MPLAKRSATTDLNHDNWDQEEAEEERGVFRLAPVEEINRRVIKRAVRRRPAFADSNKTSTEAQKNVFGGLNLKGIAAPEAECFTLLKPDVGLGKTEDKEAKESMSLNSENPGKPRNPFANLLFGKPTIEKGPVTSFDFLHGDKNNDLKDNQTIIKESEVQDTSKNPFQTLPPTHTFLGAGRYQSFDFLCGEITEAASLTTNKNNTKETSETTSSTEICPELKMPSRSPQPKAPEVDEDTE